MSALDVPRACSLRCEPAFWLVPHRDDLHALELTIKLDIIDCCPVRAATRSLAVEREHTPEVPLVAGIRPRANLEGNREVRAQRQHA